MRAQRALRDIYVTVLLGGAMYVGPANADDILNTIALSQRTVGVTATLSGIVAAFTLYAYWRRRTWAVPISTLWAILVTFTAVLATIVYGGDLLSAVIAFLVAGLIAASMVLACRSRLKDAQKIKQMKQL